MARTLSDRFKTRIHSLEGDGDPLVLLLTLSNTDFLDDYRYVTDNDDLLSRGNTFESKGFTLNLPTESENLATLDISIESIDQMLIKELRSTALPTSVLIEAVFSDYPDEVEFSYDKYVVRRLGFAGTSMTISCEIDDFLLDAFPKDIVTQREYPGVF